MGKRYDARKMTELCDSISHVISDFTAKAEMLENEYSAYNSNNTYRGEAANASKEFVYKGQGKLIKEQVRVLNKLSKKFNETQDAFSTMVDSSPNAKIDMDVLEGNKRFFSIQNDRFEDKALQMERVSREICDRFERFGYITEIRYDRAKYDFEDFCGYSGFMNKSMRSFEQFDEETRSYIKSSELDRYMYDIETDTKATMNALNGMKVYNPDVKKITMTPVAQMAAKMMCIAGIQPSSNNSISSDKEIKNWAKLLNVKCSLKTVVGKDKITQAAELALLNCKTDKDKIAVQKCAASMMAADTLVLQDIIQQLENFAQQLGPYGGPLMLAIFIVVLINFAVELAGTINQFVTPKPKEEKSHIIDVPPTEDKKPIIEKPTPVPQGPSVTDIPSGDVEEKELGRDIFPKTPADEQTPKIITSKSFSEMTDEELEEYGLKRHSDGSIRDTKGRFAGNSGVIPGTPGVDITEDYLEKQGYKIRGREITVRSADGKARRYDIVVEDSEGNIIGIEVKSGSATRTKQQVEIDKELNSNGGLDTVGKNAEQADVNHIDSTIEVHVDADGNVTMPSESGGP